MSDEHTRVGIVGPSCTASRRHPAPLGQSCTRTRHSNHSHAMVCACMCVLCACSCLCQCLFLIECLSPPSPSAPFCSLPICCADRALLRGCDVLAFGAVSSDPAAPNDRLNQFGAILGACCVCFTGNLGMCGRAGEVERGRERSREVERGRERQRECVYACLVYGTHVAPTSLSFHTHTRTHTRTRTHTHSLTHSLTDPSFPLPSSLRCSVPKQRRRSDEAGLLLCPCDSTALCLT